MPELEPLTAVQSVRPMLSGRRLMELAVNGGFAIDDSTGNRMIEALRAALEALEDRWSELSKFEQHPPMSDTPAARWVAQHMVDTATDADGLLTQLRASREEFPTYVEAIELAKRAYRETETEIGQEFTAIGGRLGGVED